MSDYELIDGAGEHDSVRVTVTTIEMPAQVARGLTNADDVRRAVAPFVTGDAVAFSPSERPHPVRDTLRHWSPFRPFAGMLANYRLARAALGTSGKLGILYICVAAGLASVVWRHASIPIGIAGGLLVSVILFVRTGACHEYLTAIEDAHSVPPLDVVLRYNVDHLRRRIRTLWRR